MGDDFWIVPVGFVACFAMSMCMGANDVANAFGTSVGSGAITLRQAYVIAGVMNVLGAVSMSGAVTETIRKGIVDLERFEDHPSELMLLMLCAMVGSLVYVGLATWRRMPVSTTQAVLGGLVGAMIAYDGPSGVRWMDPGSVCTYGRDSGTVKCGGVVGVVLQWFVAPLISACIALGLFLISKAVLLKVDPTVALRRAPPLMAFYLGVVAFALAWFIIVQQQHHPHTRGWDPRDRRLGDQASSTNFSTQADAAAPVNHATALEVLSCAFIGVFVAYAALTLFALEPRALTWSLVDLGRPAVVGDSSAAPADQSYAAVTHGQDEEAPRRGSLEMMTARNNPLRDNNYAEAEGAALQDISLEDETKSPREGELPAVPSPFDDEDDEDDQGAVTRASPAATRAAAEVYDPRVERVFGTAQVCSASLSAFAAGANDIANEVAPIAAIWQTYHQGKVVGIVRTPHWLYLYAGAGVAVGLSTFGRRVMRTIGHDCTKITPSRGFNVELGYSLASLIASAEGWPVSTTQLCVGAVVGVALVSGEDASKSLNRDLLFRIFMSWVATPVTSGCIAAIVFVVLRPALA